MSWPLGLVKPPHVGVNQHGGAAWLSNGAGPLNPGLPRAHGCSTADENTRSKRVPWPPWPRISWRADGPAAASAADAFPGCTLPHVAQAFVTAGRGGEGRGQWLKGRSEGKIIFAVFSEMKVSSPHARQELPSRTRMEVRHTSPWSLGSATPACGRCRSVSCATLAGRHLLRGHQV